MGCMSRFGSSIKNRGMQGCITFNARSWCEEPRSLGESATWSSVTVAVPVAMTIVAAPTMALVAVVVVAAVSPDIDVTLGLLHRLGEADRCVDRSPAVVVKLLRVLSELASVSLHQDQRLGLEPALTNEGQRTVAGVRDLGDLLHREGGADTTTPNWNRDLGRVISRRGSTNPRLGSLRTARQDQEGTHRDEAQEESHAHGAPPKSESNHEKRPRGRTPRF